MVNVELLWAVTARPTYASLPIAGVNVPTFVQFTPSGDPSPVTTVPLRVRRSHHGMAPEGPAVQLQLLPVGVRHWKPVPEPALIIMCANAEFEARLSRSMMPAFDQASAQARLVTRATNWKSPETGTYT